jgi:hypothetical protein
MENETILEDGAETPNEEVTHETEKEMEAEIVPEYKTEFPEEEIKKEGADFIPEQPEGEVVNEPTVDETATMEANNESPEDATDDDINEAEMKAEEANEYNPEGEETPVETEDNDTPEDKGDDIDTIVFHF